jgi:hypothetical protein
MIPGGEEMRRYASLRLALRAGRPRSIAPLHKETGERGRPARFVGRAYLPDIGPSNMRLRRMNRPCRASMPDLRTQGRLMIPGGEEMRRYASLRLALRAGRPRSLAPLGKETRVRGRPARFVGREPMPDMGSSNMRLRLMNRPCRAGLPDLRTAPPARRRGAWHAPATALPQSLRPVRGAPLRARSCA